MKISRKKLAFLGIGLACITCLGIFGLTPDPHELRAKRGQVEHDSVNEAMPVSTNRDPAPRDSERLAEDLAPPRRFDTLEEVQQARAFKRLVEETVFARAQVVVDGCLGAVNGERVAATMLVSLSQVAQEASQTTFLIDRVLMNPVQGEVVAIDAPTTRCTDTLRGMTIALPAADVTSPQVTNLPISILIPATDLPS